MKLMGLLDGILSVHGFAANLTSLLGSQERTYAPADHFMIVGNQNSHSGLPSIFDTRKLRLSSSDVAAEFVRGLRSVQRKIGCWADQFFSRPIR
jgi:hypothetical protein